MKLRIMLTWVVSAWFVSSALAQNNTQQVTAVQYYFNTDPGVGVAGNGAILPVTPTSNYNQTISITVPGSLSTGFQNLYVRMRDEFGKWSLPERRLFYINTATSTTTQDITAYQYYFDTDPGVGVAGNGAIVPVTQTSNYNASVSITVPSSLTTGFHNLYVRTLDVLGRWSLIERRLFYINTATSTATQDIKAYQYYFDTDPGVGVTGNGAIVPVTQTSNYNATVSVTVPNSLATGFHNLYVRTLDVLGRWSLIERRLFYINTATSTATQDITAYQYYFDTDPGVGAAGNGAIVPVTQTANYNASVTIVVPGSLTTGFHNLYVRTKDLLGRWSLIERRLFYINTATSTATQDITAYQYYFDTDPGVGVAGNGAIIPVTQTANYNASVTIVVPGSLTTGFHNLYVRTLDVLGRWSLIERRLFYINTATSTATQDITAYQYYFDTDPGVGVAGNGTIVPVTQTGNYNASVSIAVPGSLTTGFHNLYVRTKDILGRWSLIERRLFYINTATSFATQDITALEFYYDNDPGVGNGNTIPVTTAASINATFSVNVPCLSTGIHYLYVRAKNESARWSIIEKDTITVTSGISASSVTPPGPVNMCASDSVTLSANLLAGVTYQWLLNGSDIPGATTNSYVVHSAGNYSLKTTCGSSFVTSNVVVVTIVPLLIFYADADNDSYGNLAVTRQACIQPSGFVSNNNDCNDTNNAIHPNATETCNGIDDDCDGLTDDADPSITGQGTWYVDADGDGFGNAANSILACNQPAGRVSNSTDCNDAVNAIHPGAVELCDGVDNNCNGQIDESNTQSFVLRSGNGSIGQTDAAVRMLVGPDDTNFPSLFTTSDFSAARNGSPAQITQNHPAWIQTLPADPLAKWINNTGSNGSGNTCLYAIDFQLNSAVDTAQIDFFYAADNFLGGGPNQGVYLNGQALSGSTSGGTFNPQFNFTRNDIASLLHQGLNTLYVNATDAGSPGGVIFSANITINFSCPTQTWYADADGDSFGNPAVRSHATTRPDGFVTNSTDCNDLNNAVHPGTVEICNGFDDDCDGLTDDADPGITGQSTWYADADVDGFGNLSDSTHACTQPAGYVSNHTDCNDANNTIHPAGNSGTVSGISPLCIGATATYSSNGETGGVWSSTNITVATVNASTGDVFAVSNGTANIKYTVTGCSISVSSQKLLTVNPNVNAGTVTGVSSLCIGSSTFYNSTGTPGGTWSSSDISVATVNVSSGLVTAISSGTANITYSLTGCGGSSAASKTLTTGVSLSAGTINGPSILCIGGIQTFSSSGSPGGTWGSSNTAIALVNSSSGQVTALTAGVVSITYNVAGCNGSVTASKIVTVISVATADTITGPSLICIGAIIPFGSSGTPGGSWSSSAPSVASVNSSSGVVTALASGTTNIIYTVTACGNTFISSKSLTVGSPVSAGLISSSSPLCVGDTITLTGSGTAGGVWSSSNTAIATVNNSSGLVTAVNDSITTILYSVTGCNGKLSSSQILTVIATASAGVVNGSSPLCIGSNATYTSDGTIGGIWTSDNIAVASVNSSTGLVNALTAGTAIITYRVAGCSGTFNASKTLTVTGHAPVFSFSNNADFTTSVVFPTDGEPFNSYRFEVKYTDADGELPAPGFPRFMLDYEGNGIFSDPQDMNIIMSPLIPGDLNVTDGKIYFVVLTGLPLGTDWTANFYARATGGCETQSAPFAGPNITTPPNLSIFADDITFSNSHPAPSGAITVFAVIHNDSPEDVHDIFVHLVNQYDSNATYPDIFIPILQADTDIVVSWPVLTPAIPAWVPMQVVVDYGDLVEEINEFDNQAIRPFINGNFVVPGNIKITAGGASSVCQSTFYSVCGHAKYEHTAVVLRDPSVAGATVTVTIPQTGQVFTSFTNSLGNYCVSFLAPTEIGTYSLEISITDFTIEGDTTFSFSTFACPPPPPPNGPDLISEITLDAGEVFTGNPITGIVMIKNVGNQPAGTSIADVYLSSIGTGGAQQLPTPSLVPGASYTASFSFVSPIAFGGESVVSRADATNIVTETEERNNTDEERIRICPLQPDLAAGCPEYPPTIYLCDNSYSFSIGNSTCIPVSSPFDVLMEVFQNSILIKSERRTITASVPRDGGLGVLFTNIFPAAGNYFVRFSVDVNNSLAEVDEFNNICSSPFSVIECKPELSITSTCSPISPVDPSIPGFITVHTTLHNGGHGASAIAPFVVDFEVAGNHYPVSITSDLPVGSSIPVPGTFPTPPYGCPKVTIIADATNVVDEYDENNTAQINLSWDFSLWRICYDPEPDEDGNVLPNPNFWEGPHNVGEPVSLSVGIVNYSTYTASLVHTRFEVTGPGITGWMDLGFATAVNVSQTCGICKSTNEISPLQINIPNSFVFPQVGIYQVRMTTDQDNRYIECNENNNVMIVDVTITNFPDYRTLSKFIAPSLLNPQIGQPITIDVTYQNIGAPNILDSLDVLVKVDNLPHQAVRVKGLLGGATFTAHFTHQWASILPGLHIIRAIVDSRHERPEPNELNNEATRSIVVGKAANLYFQVFSPDNSFPSIGQPISINARIGNSGDLNCAVDVQFFYLNDSFDSIPIGTRHISVSGRDSSTIVLPWSVLDNTTTLIGRIVNPSVIQIKSDDKEAVAKLDDIAVSIVPTPGCFGGNDGTLTASVSGGEPPITFVWNTGATGQTLTAPPGTYTVTATDAGGSVRTGQGRIRALPPPSFYEDADGDGFGNPASIQEECSQPSGYVRDNTDCNDARAATHPGAIEVCNSIDDNCNGQIDEGVLLKFFSDEDHDGFGNRDVYEEACSAPAGFISDSTDCNDTRITAHPGASEVCNGIDDNCNGEIDEGVSTTYYRDYDGDGYGNPNVTTQECTLPTGFLTVGGDCNDSNTVVHPGVTEVCNSIDDNCNGLVDEGVLILFYRDSDNDGYGDSTISKPACFPPLGYVANHSDCNDGFASVHPGVTETCNNIDDNCNGQVDEGLLHTFYRDADGDGYGNPLAVIQACSAPPGYISNNTDCNDAIAAIHPGAIETCNGVDDNCNTQIDEGLLHTFYQDLDGDGYGNPASAIQACFAPVGYVSSNTDCNDIIAAIHPGAIEICNGLDDNCNNQIDEGVLRTFYRDLDGDGYGNLTSTTQACSVPTGYVSNSTDCNDSKAGVNPGATELCNSIDDNCNGTVDEGCNTCTMTVNIRPDEDTYYGYANDQTVTRTVIPTGGTAPYTFIWTLNRALKCNMVVATGDEVFSVNGGSCTNTTCPTSGSLTIAPRCTTSGNTSTGTFTLIDTGIVCVTVKDARNCSATSCFKIAAIDARCFTGNNGKNKVIICHRTGSTNNPWVQICVDKNAAPTLVAHGDYVGNCKAVRLGNNIVEEEDDEEFVVFPNPAHDRLNIRFNTVHSEDYVLQLIDMTGRVIRSITDQSAVGNNLIELGLENLSYGIYMITFSSSETSEQVRVIIE